MGDSDELALDDEPTMEIEDDLSVSDEPTIQLDDEDSLTVSDDEVSASDEEEDGGMAPDADSGYFGAVSEGSSIGAFTAMLIVSFLAYSGALAMVLWKLSEYSEKGAFPW